jgi:glycosyltransferase involved in cell wall biosynthesis
MQFSVIVCTYNRFQNLPACLGHLARQHGVDGLEWEVVVVDNNSTDRTPEAVRELSRQLPINIRYLREPQQGLNYARNRGVTESSGSYFSFIDDDIATDANWLAAVFSCFQRNDADAVGGRIHLDPSLKLPAWIKPEMYGFLGYQDLGESAFQMDGVNNYPFGGNMAFNRRVVERIGLFNPKLGRRGSGQKRSELFKGAETDYFHRLAAAGHARILYEPKAIVYHQVLPFQLTKRYFRTIHFNAGYQKAYNDPQAYRRQLFGIPLFLFPQVGRSTVKYLRQLIGSGRDLAFHQQMITGHFLGMMSGYAKRGNRIE